ncbi:MAG TPA: class I tRNA ligase family protein, partial [Spirochaetia bacterium]|nr:class I tRNA ligase family protein [Spirochaetia bacterium]
MSRSKENFRPRNEHEVKVFTCGPSTYRRPHIGNYRTFLYEDVLVRYLTFKGFQVDRVINFTDVEDKTISEAADKKQKMKELTDEVAKHFHHETKLLKIKLPSKIPTSSTSVDQAVKLIQDLVEKGFAYWYEGNVFFEPKKFKGFGKLFRLDMSKWPKSNVRFKRDTYNGNRWNRGDFILWHGYKEGDVAVWNTPIGRGRPSWNVQDPAMITATLGYEIDINCGGIDNIYRHHDYNIAIIEALSGKTYANYYLHGEHLIVNGKKMSKSSGNILYPDELNDEGVNPDHLRFFLTATKHYRTKLNFTYDRLKTRAAVLEEVRAEIGVLTKGSPRSKGIQAPQTSGQIEKIIDSLLPEFEKQMEDDMNLPGAFE